VVTDRGPILAHAPGHFSDISSTINELFLKLCAEFPLRK